MSLTLEQEASASDIHHHSLMLATAGSGKTKTIIEKTNRILKADYSFQGCSYYIHERCSK